MGAISPAWGLRKQLITPAGRQLGRALGCLHMQFRELSLSPLAPLGPWGWPGSSAASPREARTLIITRPQILWLNDMYLESGRVNNDVRHSSCDYQIDRYQAQSISTLDAPLVLILDVLTERVWDSRR